MDLYNDSHEKVCILSGIKETCITSTLKTGDKEITFEFRKTNRYATDIKEEGYIRTDTDEFVIKQVEPSGEWYKCTGTLNVEELEGKQYPQGFETVEKTVRGNRRNWMESHPVRCFQKENNPDRAELFCMGCRSTGNYNV